MFGREREREDVFARVCYGLWQFVTLIYNSTRCAVLWCVSVERGGSVRAARPSRERCLSGPVGNRSGRQPSAQACGESSWIVQNVCVRKAPVWTEPHLYLSFCKSSKHLVFPQPDGSRSAPPHREVRWGVSCGRLPHRGLVINKLRGHSGVFQLGCGTIFPKVPRETRKRSRLDVL